MYTLEDNHRMYCIRANFLKHPQECMCEVGNTLPEIDPCIEEQEVCRICHRYPEKCICA